MSENKAIHSLFKEVCEKSLNHTLPRYEELPVIDLYMDQVIAVMEKYLSLYYPVYDNKIITPAIINNYVKLKIIPPPKAKKYSKIHLAYLIVICLLKQTLSIKTISDMINLGLKTTDIKTLYNSFCDSYEDVLKNTIENAQNTVSKPKEKLYSAYSSLTIHSAISSTINRFVCENVIKFNDETKKRKRPNNDKQP